MDLTNVEQMLIARLVPAIHVLMFKHSSIVCRRHYTAFPKAVQEPATILSRSPEYVDTICVRKQGKDDTHKEHSLWYQDGRFAKHNVWKFMVNIMMMRIGVLEQSHYFIDQQLGTLTLLLLICKIA